MDPLANLNGTILPLAETRIPVLDRGFLFGDAVYEVLRVYQGKPWRMAEHFARLGRSLEAIRIQGVDLERLKARMFETIAAGAVAGGGGFAPDTAGGGPRPQALSRGGARRG